MGLTNPIGLGTLTGMKKNFVLFLVVTFIAASLALPASAAVKTGAKCATKGQTINSQGKKFTCVKTGKKLLWAQIIVETKSTPTPKPSISPLYYQPKVGDCFNYGWDQAMFKNVSDQPVNCQLSHTAETYRVQVWSSPIDVYQDTDENVLAVAKSICEPMSYKPSTSITQNYFIFSFPSEPQWNSGNKWVRCDAVILNRSGKVPNLISWQGEPPVRQDVPATCTVESSKSNSWTRTYEEETTIQRKMGFYVRNSSLDRDATLVLITANLRYTDGTSEDILFEISRIPAGQLVGIGKDFESKELSGWSYKIKCNDSPKGSTAKLIELTAPVVKDEGSDRYSLRYSAQATNLYPDVIRCKNDNYSCMVYILFLDPYDAVVGGDTIFINGPIYPNQSFKVEGSIYYPKSWHPERLSSVKMWIQEPQS